nr:Uncharacterised protein [Acinetobacter phage MD-2021b]CAH1066812.1 Uncharacterised protein [Acinetobacter phage MD-2021b]CAH1067231.1 Uncharacterised protein [Acinetobacter phage MD-2021b]
MNNAPASKIYFILSISVSRSIRTVPSGIAGSTFKVTALTWDTVYPKSSTATSLRKTCTASYFSSYSKLIGKSSVGVVTTVSVNERNIFINYQSSKASAKASNNTAELAILFFFSVIKSGSPVANSLTKFHVLPNGAKAVTEL